MKAVTRQRPKNANYSVSSNPTCTNGAPLKAKAKPKPNANAHPSASKPSEQSQPRKQAGGGVGVGVGAGAGVGGKMTKFRSLDDIPDFTDDFGKDKSDFHSDCGNSSPTPHYSPAPVVNRFQHNDPPVVSSYGRVEDKRQVPPLQVQSKAPPPLPAESARSNMKQFSPPKKSNPAPTYFDDNSCDSVDTDLSDDDDECNHSYFSSKDDYNVDYTPGKSGGVQHKSRVVKPTKPVQKSYPTKQPQSSQQSDYGKYDHASNNRPPKEPREINYKYVLYIFHWRFIIFLLFISLFLITLNNRPYTLKQYRKIKPQEYVEYSKLKPGRCGFVCPFVLGIITHYYLYD